MSEKIYALLLRLYPARFRETYGDAALQLFRDRWRDEQGFFAKSRVWFDVLFDLAWSLPCQYRRTQPALTASAQRRIDAPSFHMLEEDPLRPGALYFGGALALAFMWVFLVLFNQVGKHGPLRISTVQPSRDYTPTPDRHANRSDANANANASEFGSSASDASDDTMASSLQTKQLLPQPPKLLDATTAMLALFHTHNIVMFGETHGGKQEYEWLCRLVKTPEFADRVDDIVVEFGNAFDQETVDRYVAGDDVPADQVQKAWRDMIASVPPVSPVYGWFYQAVREANRNRHGKHQIRLLMGSPPGDWDKIKSSNDLAPYESEREQWYAQVVKDQVLAKHHRALLIMGAGHFLRGFDQVLQNELQVQQHHAAPPMSRTKLSPGYIERELRAAGADPYLVVMGTNAVDSRGGVDKRFESWPAPVIVPLSGNWVGTLPAQPVISGGHAPATPLMLADEADALLYVAPCNSLSTVNVSQAEVDGTPYGKEVARRNMIKVGHPVSISYGEVPGCVQGRQGP